MKKILIISLLLAIGFVGCHSCNERGCDKQKKDENKKEKEEITKEPPIFSESKKTIADPQHKDILELVKQSYSVSKKLFEVQKELQENQEVLVKVQEEHKVLLDKHDKVLQELQKEKKKSKGWDGF